MYKIRFILNKDPNHNYHYNSFYQEFGSVINDSQFKADLFFRPSTGRKSAKIEVGNVRLRQNKPRCSYHIDCRGEKGTPTLFSPLGCKVRNLSFLNTSDWIEFNKLVNDLLDKWQIPANVTSLGGNKKIRLGMTRFY